MRQCLTSDLGGYYTSTALSDSDQFGSKGDFVTSPEISQIFGELIGVWIVAEWIAQGRKTEGVCLMEMGPGRGTLMDDVLRTVRNFPPLAKAIEAVYLVEASQNLRLAQHKLLCGDTPLLRNDLGFESTSKHSKDLRIIWTEDIRFVPRTTDKAPFIIAHEFFDALPIHVFQSVLPNPQQADNAAQSQSTALGQVDSTASSPGWTKDEIARLAQLRVDQGLNWEEVAKQLQRSILDVRAKYYELSMPNKASEAVPRRSASGKSQGNQWRELVVSPKPPHRLKEDEPEFELTKSRAGTPHSMYLPETSARYRALKDIDGATIEISPESQAYARDFAIRLGGLNPQEATKGSAVTPVTARTVSSAPSEEAFLKREPSGAALIIDYGPASTIPANSLRGIKQHRRVSPFLSPGTTDVSADVDFLALAESAINASPGVEVHGPVEQGRFLTAMGIEERAAQLVKQAVDRERGGSTGQDKAELTELVKRIESGWKRLVDRGPQGMGRLYQVMAITPYKPAKEGQPRRRPVGFGGDITV
ncbi:hypothetical protein BAUCODRAFT_27137 [Baudoinia panamericana UAMH 10762]|uniref:Protein arginine methyltransferase NDUFAF7 n=1 Tax=Baudoinia panamericana (strain UAMH 10762) TaxID=717646 RepID=M2N1H7_BAUPA|nr:uncharacterized protein BAUCODRAFT_27137 [Baudoinia panamericana UAMH 10762]EMC92799.1 hypothetical protein BAUCODRAFT_27137 [Baudoinia panamericana UAMH 10762]